MEWTREKRYLPYEKWDVKTLLELQSQAARSDYQLHYHIRLTSGLLNDPNGFSYYNGRWQVFYQAYPWFEVLGALDQFRPGSLGKPGRSCLS